jgi:hypothetical protein
LPFGSVTLISLPILASGVSVVSETAFGAIVSIAPLIGVVLVKEFAEAGNARTAEVATVKNSAAKKRSTRDVARITNLLIIR